MKTKHLILFAALLSAGAKVHGMDGMDGRSVEREFAAISEILSNPIRVPSYEQRDEIARSLEKLLEAHLITEEEIKKLLSGKNDTHKKAAHDIRRALGIELENHETYKEDLTETIQQLLSLANVGDKNESEVRANSLRFLILDHKDILPGYEVARLVNERTCPKEDLREIILGEES